MTPLSCTSNRTGPCKRFRTAVQMYTYSLQWIKLRVEVHEWKCWLRLWSYFTQDISCKQSKRQMKTFLCGNYTVSGKKVQLYFLPQLCQIFTTHHDSLLTCALEVVLLIYLLLITLVTTLKRSAKKRLSGPAEQLRRVLKIIGIGGTITQLLSPVYRRATPNTSCVCMCL